MHKLVCVLAGINKVYLVDLQNKKASAVCRGDDFYPYFSPWAQSQNLESYLIKIGRNAVALLGEDFQEKEVIDLKHRVQHIYSFRQTMFSIICKEAIFLLQIEEDNRSLEKLPIPSEIKVKVE